MLILGILNHLS